MTTCIKRPSITPSTKTDCYIRLYLLSFVRSCLDLIMNLSLSWVTWPSSRSPFHPRKKISVKLLTFITEQFALWWDFSAFISRYPFSENVTKPSEFLGTRCPAWCDRVFMSHAARALLQKVSLRHRCTRIRLPLPSLLLIPFIFYRVKRVKHVYSMGGLGETSVWGITR